MVRLVAPERAARRIAEPERAAQAVRPRIAAAVVAAAPGVACLAFAGVAGQVVSLDHWAGSTVDCDTALAWANNSTLARPVDRSHTLTTRFVVLVTS